MEMCIKVQLLLCWEYLYLYSWGVLISNFYCVFVTSLSDFGIIVMLASEIQLSDEPFIFYKNICAGLNVIASYITDEIHQGKYFSIGFPFGEYYSQQIQCL